MSGQETDKHLVRGRKLYDMWSKCNGILKQYMRTHDFIRPEVMVSCITRMPNLLTTKEFYEKFHSLSQAVPNKNHMLLAAFLEQGGVIYTTNFDVCIEKAYEEAYQQKLRKEVCCNGKGSGFCDSCRRKGDSLTRNF